MTASHVHTQANTLISLIPVIPATWPMAKLQDIPQGRGERDRPDQVGRHENLQTRQEIPCPPEGLPAITGPRAWVPQSVGFQSTFPGGTRRSAAFEVLRIAVSRHDAPVDDVEYRWRGELTDAEMVELVMAHGGRARAGWWDQIRPHALGWVTARRADGLLVGFVNVAWDGGDHAVLLDTKVRTEYQRRGIATEIVRLAVTHSRDAGCEWLHVDFVSHLEPFYFDACGFRPTSAGVIYLPGPE